MYMRMNTNYLWGLITRGKSATQKLSVADRRSLVVHERTFITSVALHWFKSSLAQTALDPGFWTGMNFFQVFHQYAKKTFHRSRIWRRSRTNFRGVNGKIEIKVSGDPQHLVPQLELFIATKGVVRFSASPFTSSSGDVPQIKVARTYSWKPLPAVARPHHPARSFCALLDPQTFLIAKLFYRSDAPCHTTGAR